MSAEFNYGIFFRLRGHETRLFDRFTVDASCLLCSLEDTLVSHLTTRRDNAININISRVLLSPKESGGGGDRDIY